MNDFEDARQTRVLNVFVVFLLYQGLLVLISSHTPLPGGHRPICYHLLTNGTHMDGFKCCCALLNTPLPGVLLSLLLTVGKEGVVYLRGRRTWRPSEGVRSPVPSRPRAVEPWEMTEIPAETNALFLRGSVCRFRPFPGNPTLKNPPRQFQG